MKGQLVKLIVLVVIFAGLVVFYMYDKDKIEKEETRKTEEKRICLFSKDDVKSTTIMRPGQEDLTISLRADKTWEVKQGSITADGDEPAINTLLSTVAGAKRERVAIKSATDMAKFGLSEPALVAIVSPTGATPAVTLHIGNSAPDQSFVYARVKDSSDVFLVSKTVQTSADKTLLDLRNKQIVKADPMEMQALTVNSATGSVTVNKGSDGFWRVTSPFAGLAVKDTVEAVLRKVDSARAKDFIDDATDLGMYGLLSDATQITITGKDQAIRSVTIGKKDELAGGYYVKRAGSPVVMVVGDDFVQETLGKKPEAYREMGLFSFKYYNSDIFEVTSTNNTYKLANENYNWFVKSPVSATCEYSNVTERLRAVIDESKADRFVDSVTDAVAFGFETPSATISARQRDGGYQTVILGKEISGGSEIFAKRLIDGAVMVVSTDVLDQAIGPVDEIIKKPPTPTPAPVPEGVSSATGMMEAPSAVIGSATESMDPNIKLLESPEEMLHNMTESATEG